MRARLPVLLLALLGVGLVAGCGSSKDSSAAKSRSATASTQRVSFDAPGTLPQLPAPPLKLRDYRGKTVDIRQYRGKAVLVTFIYSHCPDICPLIVGNLHTSLGQLGANAKDVQIIAVSTDPKGDTPKTVRAFVKAHQMSGKMDYLIGSKAQLAKAWKAWGIAVEPDKATPDSVEHSALIYGITASGHTRVAYPANFKPKWLVHDVPQLAKL